MPSNARTRNGSKQIVEEEEDTSETVSFVREFRATFGSLPELVDRILSPDSFRVGKRFRGLLWSVLLGVLDNEEGGFGFQGDWEVSLARSRARYESLLRKHSFDVRRMASASPEREHPLSTHSSSSWNQYFLNSDLREEILRDVVRTYPGNPLFRSQSMQSTLADILFIYAKEFPSIAYKQGMHEILAAVLLVIREGMESYVRVKSLGELPSIDPELASLFKVIFDPLYNEHDAYLLFECIMKRMTDWYWSPSSHSPPPMSASGPGGRKKAFPISDVDKLFEERTTPPWDSSSDEARETPNPSKRLSHMWNDVLALNDGELYEHLEALGIIPTTFGINWLKLLYSRQFFENWAFWEIWDVIFATNFILQDYVLVAMLHAIRFELLKGDNTVCNTLLVSSYPKYVDVQYVVKYSLYLFDGVRYPRPQEVARKNSGPRRKSSLEVNLRRPSALGLTRGNPSSPREKQEVNKSMELSEYLTDDEVRRSHELLRGRISSWKKGLDLNVEFLRSIFKEEDIKDVQEFDKALSNLKNISREMRGALKGKKMTSQRGLNSSAFGEEALSLIQDN